MKFLIFSLFIFIKLNEINGALTSLDFNKTQIQSKAKENPIITKILIIVEEFKNRMCYEIPKFNLPILDPFKYEELEINLIKDFEIKMSNIIVKGLSNLQVQNLKFQALLQRFQGRIQLDHIHAMTDYTAKGSIPNLMEIDGKGKISLEIGFGIDFSIRLITSLEGKLSIRIEKLEPSLVIHQFRITGLFPDDDLNKFVEDLVKDLGPELIGDVWNENKGFVIELLQMLLSEPISDMTIKELLALITSDKPIFDEEDPEPNCREEKFLQKIKFQPSTNLLLKNFIRYHY